MKPFNLDEFKAGKPAVRRDGRKAYFLAFVPDARENCQLVYKTDVPTASGYAIICTTCPSGQCVPGCWSDHDLVGMAPTRKTVWVNIHANGFARWFNTEDNAKIYRDISDFITCAKIEWEE